MLYFILLVAVLMGPIYCLIGGWLVQCGRSGQSTLPNLRTIFTRKTPDAEKTARTPLPDVRA